MYKRFRHILMLIVLISGALQALGQIVMPDDICVGINRRYWVVGSAGSVYTWKIDGVVQTSTADFINITWATAGTFNLEVQEHLDNCNGDVQTGVVKVVDFPVLDVPLPVVVCDSYTLPPITGNHLTPNVAYYDADPALGGKIISGTLTSNLKVWIFDETKTTPNCTDKKSFQVTINPLPNLVINQPLPECSPKTVDLTALAVTTGSDAGLIYTYWKDFAATSALTTPSAVATSGTYYIKATNPTTGCFVIKPVNVTVNPLPNLVITNPPAVCFPATVDLTVPLITTGSDIGLDYTYWTDITATVSLPTPSAVATAGTYYIKATNATTGCFSIKTVKATINPLPNLKITNPLEACYPATIDLTAPAVTSGSDSGLNFTYWTDATATSALATPSAVAITGIYYIRGTNATTGCFVIKSVNVTINPLPNLVITNPLSVCYPATVDISVPAVTIGSDNGLNFSYWNDAAATSLLSTPSAVTISGTYYIKATNAITGCPVIKSVNVTVNPVPDLIITNPPAVCFPNTVDLTLPSVTAESTLPVGTVFSYWTDLAATTALTEPPNALSISGTYCIKATNPTTGCYTTRAVKVTINPLPNLKITNPLEVCYPATIDLTAPAVTSGSDSGLNFTYWTDAAATSVLTTPSAVGTSGTYYIKATNVTTGCFIIKSVNVTVNPLPNLIITIPPAGCNPATVDLTVPSVTTGSDAGLDYTYWTDIAATASLPTPSAVETAGTYYIKATNATTGCYIIKSVNVTMSPLPNLVIINPSVICSPATVDLTASTITNGSDSGLNYSYWADAAATIALTTPSAVVTTGIYYIKATNAATGCSVIKSVNVTINPLPNLVITYPPVVCNPVTVDLTAPSVTAASQSGLDYTYWTDAAATASLTTPSAVATTGTYYIKATNPTTGCSVIKSVNVIVNPLPILIITNPPAGCNPATVDLTAPSVTTGSSAGLDFTYWTDIAATTSLPTPSAVATSGTYYIKATNATTGCSLIKLVNVTINPLPNLVITNPLAICYPGTVNLTAPAITTGSDSGLDYSYWADAIATIALTTPSAVTAAGTYYIKATNAATGCSVIKSVNVTINPLPKLVITNPPVVCNPATVDLTAPSVTTGSQSGLDYTYWTDAAATSPLTTQTAVATSGTYYIKATNTATTGCTVIKSVNVTVNPIPDLIITDPSAVCFPYTIDLTMPTITAGSTLPIGTVLSYWTDLAATSALTEPPTAVSISGIYFIRANNTTTSCSTTKAVKVTVNPLPNLVISNPLAVCSPGTVNLTAPAITTGSDSGLNYTYWTDANATSVVATPSSVSVSATYYIKATNATTGCSVIKPVNATINPEITPTFAAIGSLCQGSIAPLLPVTSIEGISGTWDIATISTLTPGTKNYTFNPTTGLCAKSVTKPVTVEPLVTPIFTPIDPLCQNTAAPALPSTSNNGIIGAWSPATISTTIAGTIRYTFTPSAGQCAIPYPMDIVVNPEITPIFTQIDPLCQNSVAPPLPKTSTNGITGIWNPATIITTTAGTKRYTFTPSAGQCAIPYPMDIDVNPEITPIFAQIDPLCQNTAAPALPKTSTNGITGVWNPATISTTASGTIRYTFMPSAGQCAVLYPMDIDVSPEIAPIFAQIDPLCQNSAAPALPPTSTNGIMGVWNPATISTTASGTIRYTFTPNVGQCAVPYPMDIDVNPEITPIFTQIDPLCQNSAAPALPSTSTNAITGVWNPATISTTTSGTIRYTFTPSTGQCAVPYPMDIDVSPEITPIFTQIDPLCQNSAAPVLPKTSTNGITGIWSPAIVSTTFTGTFKYIFTPTAGQCAVPYPMDIDVTPEITPIFTQIGPLCQHTVAPALPKTSTNGIIGVWNPATISTTAFGTIRYTFTPSAGQCAVPYPMDIDVNPEITPIFAQIGPLCQNIVAPALPKTSTNGINGVWNPATISTTVPGKIRYTFTPSAGQCAVPYPMDINVSPEIVPTFTTIGQLCQNSVAPLLPTTSTNSITGVWDIPTISTSTPGTTNYTFTPTAGLCAAKFIMPVTVNSPVVPTFAAFGPLCFNGSAPILPKTSTNSIAGTWTPMTVTTNMIGSASYTFTPNAGQCAISNVVSIETASPIVIKEIAHVDIDNINTTGSSNISVSGGSGAGTYSFKWSDGAIIKDRTNLSVGTYTVEVTDKNNCKASLLIRIKSLILDITCPPAPNNIEKLSDLPVPYKDYFEWMLYGGTVKPNGCSIVLVELLSQSLSPPSVCPMVVTRTYQLVDDCGNKDQCQQVITFKDNTLPVFDVFPGAIDTQCLIPPPYSYNDFLNGNIVANDNCSVNYDSFKMINESPIIPGCPLTITRTYQIADNSGNVSLPKVQTITVNDTERPVISCPPITYYNTLAEIPAQFTNGTTTDFMSAGGTITDNCGVDQSTFKFVSEVSDPTSFPRVVKRTYEIADFCGNTSQCEQTITYGPKLTPTLICPVDLNLSCSAKIPDVYTDYNLFIKDGGKATTSCSVLPGTFKLMDEKTTPGKCAYDKSIVRTYQVTDNCGEPLVGTQTINIQDTDLPTFNAPGDITIYTDANCIYNKTVAVTGDATNVLDNCSTGLKATFVDAAPVALAGCKGGFTIVRTWSLKDECGNLAKDQVQKITVRDNLAPIISGTTPLNACGTLPVPYSNLTEFTKDGGKASDNCSLSESSFKFVSDTPVSATVITRRYQISDECGNTNYFDQTINIYPIPSIKVTGVDPVACGANGTLNFTFTNVPNGIFDVSYNSGQLLKGVTVSNNTAVFSALAGTYNNLKIAVNGCSSPDGVSKILSDPTPPIYLVSGTNPTQCNADDGIITISNLNVSTEYSVSLDHGNTFNYISSNPGGKIQIGQQRAGSFGIILRLLSCIGGEKPLTLSDPASPTIISAKPIDPLLCGGIGSIDFTFTNVPDGKYDILYDGGKFSQVLVTDSKATFPAAVAAYKNLKLTIDLCSSPVGVDVTVNNPETPIYTVIPTNPISCKGNDGSILISTLKTNTDYSVSVDNGSKFTILKSNSSGEIKVDLLGAGSYNVILSLSGCTGLPQTVTLTDPIPPSFGVSANQPTVCGGKGYLGFSSGNTPDGLYDILYEGGQFSQVDFKNGFGSVQPQSGIYKNLRIIVNGCSSPDGYSTTLINPPAPIYVVNQTNPKGCQYNDGTITISGLKINTVYDVTTDGGTTFISKASDSNGEIKIDKLKAGSYGVAVRFSAGCVGIVKSVTLSDPLLPTLAASVTQPTDCNLNGTISFSFTNVPNGKYDITYNSGQFSGVQILNGISNEVSAPVGTYNNLKITVNGCVSTDIVNKILTNPPTPDYMVQPVHPTICKLNDGAISVSALNPNRIYAVSTDSGANFYNKTSNSAGEIYIGSLVEGNYGVILSLSGCKGLEKPVTLVNLPLPVIVSETHSDPIVCGGNGTINLSFSNVPDGKYDLFYDLGKFAQVAVKNGSAVVSAPTGKYDNLKVIVNGCNSVDGVSIDLSDPLAPTVPEASIKNQPSCLTVKGTIEVTTPLGAIYEYSVDGKQYQASPVFALDPGNYTVTVKETATGCLKTAATPLTINSLPALPAAPIGSVVAQPTCDVPTGTIEVTVPLAPIYEYSVDGKPYQISPVFSNLAPGNYTVKVKETATGCVSTAVKLLTVNPVPAPPLVPIASVTVQPNCIVTNGTIIVSAPVGAAFQYSINGKPYQVSPVFTGVDPGNYTVSVKETATTCVTQGVSPLTVNQVPIPPIPPIASVTVQPNCIVTTGTIVVSAPVGAAFQYSINGKPYQVSPVFTGVVPGNYSVKVKEIATSCETTGATTLIVNPIPANPISPVASVTAQPTCVLPSGTIVVTTPLGSIYQYSLNGAAYQDNPVFANLAPGNYSVKVIEKATGCVSSASALMNVKPLPSGPATPSATVTVQPNCIEQTGTIKVISPIGAGYEYSRDGLTYQASTDFTGLAPGNYTIKVKETATSCISLPSSAQVVNAVPTPPAAPIASVSVQPNCNVSTGTIRVTAPLGPAYEYSIDGTTYQASSMFAGLISGNYSVRVKVVATKCVSIPTGLIIVNPAPIVPKAPVSTGNLAVCKTIPAVILNAQNAIVPQTGINIAWYNTATGGSIVTPTLGTVGNLTYYAEASNGVCISKTRTPVTLTINSLPATPKAIVSVPPTCNNMDGTVVVTSPAESTGFEYSLNNNAYQTSASFAKLKTNHYNIKVRNTMTGCVSDTVGINVPAIPPAPVIVVTAFENCLCYEGKGSISFNITNAVDGVYTIKYDGGEFSNVSIIKGVAKVAASAGVYNNLNITNEATGCNSYDPLKLITVTITQPTQIVISETITEIDLKSGQKGSINLQVIGGTGTYSFKWSTSETTQNIKNLNEGAYTVTVTDQNGCPLNKIITIPVPNYPPIAVADNFTSSCNEITGNLVANDSDPEGDPFFIEVVPIVNPLHGTVTINTDGTFKYVVNPRFDGTDSLRYAIYDSKHYQGDTASVYIYVVLDTDHDGIADVVDADADGDGILNVDEGYPNRDTDGDGIPDYLDIDSDDDGIVDNIEAQSTPGYIQPLFKDSNGNGVDDAYDPLSGGTRIIPVDTDGDGIPDFIDPDSDNDGVPDYIEGNDANHDGKPDRFLVGKDSDNDGLDDAYDTVVNDCNAIANMLGSNAPLQDFDGDGIPDWRDPDDDNDGILTRYEDLNGDGNWSNDDLDGDGHPEYLDPEINACELFIPNAFSPNGDNIHDYFQIYCIESYPNAKIYIFDQLGNKLYQKTQYGNLTLWKTPGNAWWDGKPNVGSANARNEMVPPGTYYYVLDLGNGEVRKSFVFVSY